MGMGMGRVGRVRIAVEAIRNSTKALRCDEGVSIRRVGGWNCGLG